ncbi:hypothetical protein QQS21_009689 [Conoideocrella luteorostrata]|uniref:Nucleotide exchange factor SIL1 n=1 Tax=Conoideocrella luteorostrata TaxID=1105319 RepID=A0AAJ0CJ74_9HYPO|nr:hypothetical protein QQS21_009689 [Conoideocrella luteorostrata]
MASAPQRITSPSCSLPMVILLSSFFLTSTSAAPSRPSPSSDDLICHTTNPSDCYPRQFQPTYKFKIVHDDQHLPDGLHVRFNMQGRKEAKFNVLDEEDASLEGAPVDVISFVAHSSRRGQKPRLTKDAPLHNTGSNIKKPPHDTGVFAAGLTMLQDGTNLPNHAFDEALVGLEELSHDVDYGLRIAEDTGAVKNLLCLMTSYNAVSVDGFVPRDHQAASILAGALQNNPSALHKVADAWPRLKDDKCAKEDSVLLGQALYSSFTPSKNIDSSATVKQSASSVKAKVSAINGLIKDKRFRNEFLGQSGMEHLLQVVLPKGQEWDGARRMAGQLVLDNFLDADMGAQLGEWPRGPRLSIERCKDEAFRASEGCWDYHVARIMRDNSGDDNHWSVDLARRLAKARGQNILVLDEESGEL